MKAALILTFFLAACLPEQSVQEEQRTCDPRLLEIIP